jgi:hypothetical protein
LKHVILRLVVIVVLHPVVVVRHDVFVFFAGESVLIASCAASGL